MGMCWGVERKTHVKLGKLLAYIFIYFVHLQQSYSMADLQRLQTKPRQLPPEKLLAQEVAFLVFLL
jgi:hypothetical protein